MHFKVMTILMLLTGILLSSNVLASTTNPKNPIFKPQIAHNQPTTPPQTTRSSLQRIILQSGFYEYLLHHPDFIRIQGILSRLWETQSGNKRRVVHQRNQNNIQLDD